MGFWSNLVNRIRGNNIKQLNPGQMDYNIENNVNNSNLSNFKYSLTRKDGSILQIQPELDQMGMQMYEQVFNRRTNQFQAIPKFRIMDDELKNIISNSLSKVITMDINPNLLENPKYADYIANKILSPQRLNKIINEYGSYAGTITTDENGKLYKKVDQGIIDTLNATKEENKIKVEEARRKANEKLNEENKSRAYEFNYDEHGAGDLSGKKFTGGAVNKAPTNMGNER